MDHRQITVAYRKAAPDCGNFQQRQQFAALVAAPGYFEQPQKRGRQRARQRGGAIGYRKRDLVGVRGGAEHRFDIGGVERHIRRHDQYLVRLQITMPLKQIEQLVAQHLQLPHRTVTAVYADRAVIVRDRAPGRRLSAVVERQNIVLQLRQQRLPGVGAEQIDGRRIQLLQCRQKIPALAPERGQQRIAGLQIECAALLGELPPAAFNGIDDTAPSTFRRG